MKLGVTAKARDLNAQIDPRFGRSQYFVIVDADTMDDSVCYSQRHSNRSKSPRGLK
jgi:predicted Fe-Mo cluster-binding NifX family protein